MARRTSLLSMKSFFQLAAHAAAGAEPEIRFPETAVAVRKYVDEHIYERLSIEQLAKEASLPFPADTGFPKAYGQTPYEYVLSRKIDTACLLLRNTGMTVKEVAYRLQFSDEHYFANIFRQKKGLPPENTGLPGTLEHKRYSPGRSQAAVQTRLNRNI